MTRLKVAVRVRPLSISESQQGSESVINVENDDTIAITNVKVPEQNAGDSRERIKRFSFDYCFNESTPQQEVFDVVEEIIGNAVKSRYNSCVLAYGQSSTGKTHTMMGFPHDPGLTPKICRNIFGYLQETATEEEIRNLSVSVSYLEIYNEKVRDLLSEDVDKKQLRVREHPKFGPHVQGLREHTVTNSDSLIEWLDYGNKKRSTASTLRNLKSSRSHAVFTINCNGSKVYLVDLAGSERDRNRSLTYNYTRFREGVNINRSLVALGNVISALAEETCRKRRRYVPYRDSVLTWLLKDTLGGNSNTLLIATVSPSSSCYSETVNTLRFGQRAKLIVTRPSAFVAEDPKENIIRQLRAEIAKLKELLRLNQKNQQHQQHHPGSECKLARESDKNFFNSTNLKSNLLNNSKIAVKEQLVPLMSVSSKLDEKPLRKLTRTFSVDRNFTKMEAADKEKLHFSSQEAISKQDRKPSNGSASSSSSSRRSSLKPIPQRKPLSTSLSRSNLKVNKIDKAVVTEKPRIITAKVDSIRRQPPPRAQIVAAVTNRLYSKVKKKDIATDTDDIHKYRLQTMPKELSICSNARLKLKELTQRALKAYRNKNQETQTESPAVLRVKENSTDVNDLKIDLAEMKEVEINSVVEMKDEETGCDLEKSGIVLTRSCGTQCEEFLQKHDEKFDYRSENNGETSSDGLNLKDNFNEFTKTPISFTKYLLNPKNSIELLPPITIPQSSNPIYTSSVNINISHNYINGSLDKSANGKDNETNALSDDSLENDMNMCFPTPDLISNHNSLEIKHASIETTLPEILMESAIDFTLDEGATCEKHFSKSQMHKRYLDELKSVAKTPIFAPICYLQENLERVEPFTYELPERRRAFLTESKKDEIGDDVVIVTEPKPLKSIMKKFSEDNFQAENASKDSLSNTQDSLEYHKQVHFQNDRLFNAMSSFLEEASSFMGDLKDLKDSTLEIEVSINNAPKCSHRKRKRCHHEKNCQTDTQPSSNAECQTQQDFFSNKFESLLEESCQRLEDKINKVCSPEARLWDRSEATCFNEIVEDSSLESNNLTTYSDYGSLPRRTYKRHRTPTCSPSAFLRQLTNMRRQIIESSREQFVKSQSDLNETCKRE